MQLSYSASPQGRQRNVAFLKRRIKSRPFIALSRKERRPESAAKEEEENGWGSGQAGDLLYAASKIEPLTARGKERGNVLAKNPIHSLVNRIPPLGEPGRNG